ncbi:MAG: FHA domain-containing protein [Deltaproteobacteria bacterium]|nr:FHA domain-containing protein [Deltaproteobacteria bacterium]
MKGRSIEIPEEGLSIGRDPANGLILREDGISRFHAKLHFDNGSLWLRDVGSRNGVFVNEKRVQEHKALTVGDKIAFAQQIFELRWAADEETSQAEFPPQDEGPSTTKRRWYWPF